MSKCFILFLLFGCSSILLIAQPDEIISIKNIPSEGILLNHGWKYHLGDNPEWANPGYDDNAWQSINPARDIHDVPPLWKDSVVWFRIHLDIDQQWPGNLAFALMQSGASEIYLEGQLIKSFGRISHIPKEIFAINPMEQPYSFPVTRPGLQVLAIRYQLQPEISYTTIWDNPNWAIFLKINSFEKANANYKDSRIDNEKSNSFRTSAYVILAILFLAFYVSDKKRRTSLYFFVYAAIWAIVWSLFDTPFMNIRVVGSYYYWANFSLVLQIIGFVFILTAIYELLGQRKQWGYYLIIALGVLCIPVGIFIYPYGWLAFVIGFVAVANFEMTRIAFLGFKRNKRGASILAIGAVICLGCWILFTLLSFGLNPLPFYVNQWFVFSLHHLSLPVAVSIFIGYDFAKTNQALEQKLVEVQELSEEKNQILVSQKDVLEKEVEARTHQLQESLNNLKSTQAQLIQSEKMASLGELTAGIAHEIQNPLNFVNNFSEVNTELIEEMKIELANGNQQQAIQIADDIKDNEQKINHHGKRADAIVKGMLQHSQTSAGQKEPTDINKLADEYLRLAYHGLRSKDKSFNATLKTDFDESIGNINIIPQDIGRVLLNLYNNAFYALMQKQKVLTESSKLPGQQSYVPKVTVVTKRLKDIIEIKVADNGPGIPQKIVDKIFQPFFTTKPTGQGTGLGLSLAYDIIKAHGGEIKVETNQGEGPSDPARPPEPERAGEGTEFIINLPILFT